MIEDAHRHPNDESRELTSLYALGALSAAEKTEFESHLRNGCDVCVEELKALEAATVQLSVSAQPVRPPRRLRDKLLARIGPAPVEDKDPDPERGILFQRGGLLISRSADMPWRSTPFPGLFSKLLFVDADRQYTTALVRMEPGTRYPSHRHMNMEELFMLEGELIVEGTRMVAGDYCYGAPGSVHEAVYTESGALFVVLSSQNDILLE